MFIKEHDTYKYGQYAGKDKLNTVCRIFRRFPQEKDGTCRASTQVGLGRANLNEKDSYDKIKGKKIALAEAFKHSLWEFLTKERREIVWDKFKELFNIDQQPDFTVKTKP